MYMAIFHRRPFKIFKWVLVLSDYTCIEVHACQIWCLYDAENVSYYIFVLPAAQFSLKHVIFLDPL